MYRISRSIISAILGAGLLMAGCDTSMDDGHDLGLAGGVHPEQVIYNYQLIETEAGVRLWVLESDKMVKFPGRQMLDLVRVNMDFFDHGEYYSTLVSDSGQFDTRTRDVYVCGNVVITTDDGRRLRTSELYYTSSDGLIRNNVYNVFDKGLDVMTGIGMEATPDLDYIEIYQVEAVVGDEAVSARPDTMERQ
jgi:LPS export ABC transporter protein LptC